MITKGFGNCCRQGLRVKGTSDIYLLISPPIAETFPVLQQRMRVVIQTEMQLAQMEEKYLDTEQLNIENSLQRCQKLTGTLVTMKR